MADLILASPIFDMLWLSIYTRAKAHLRTAFTLNILLSSFWFVPKVVLSV